MAVPNAFTEVATRVRNWGRWGADDEIGTLNLVDAEARRRGAASVVSGEAFALGLPLSEAEGIQVGVVEGRVNPTRTMVQVNMPVNAEQPDWVCFSEDVLTLATQCATHWDSLAHSSYGGIIYNGYPAAVSRRRAPRGVAFTGSRRWSAAASCSTWPVRSGATCSTRGTRSCPSTSTPRASSPASPSNRATSCLCVPVRWCISPRAGAICSPTCGPRPGSRSRRRSGSTPTTSRRSPPTHCPSRSFPSQHEDAYLPVHLLHLVEMGLTQGQNWVLDPLAEACAADGRYTFLLDATPLPLTSGLGSPLNPVALR